MTSKQFEMVVVGCGAMGSAMLRGWLVANLDFKLTIVTPHHQHVKDLPVKEKIRWYPHYQNVPPGPEPDVIVLAVKPDMLAEVLSAIPCSHLRSAIVVSVAAGKNLSFYYHYVSPKTAIARIMPNLPVSLHEGMSVGFFSKTCSPEQTLLVEELFKALGRFLLLENEALFHAATVISGCGPAYVYLLEESMVRAAQNIGLPEEDALVLARQTIIGAAKTLIYESAPATALKERVTSRAGVTAAARVVLEEPGIGVPDLFVKAFENAMHRSREIAGG